MTDHRDTIPSEIVRHYECVRFYNEEAELLDDRRLDEWLSLLTDDVEYRMPIRLTRERSSVESDFSEDGYHYVEDRNTLEARVERFQSEFAWSEEPPSRMRRFVTNLRIERDAEDEIQTRTNVLVFRSQGDTVRNDLLSAERFDTLRRVDGKLKVANREVRLDHTILPTKNLSFFL